MLHEKTTPPSVTSSFPRGHNVPFPYEKPYQQQIDFMDTILLSLQQQEVEPQQENHDPDILKNQESSMVSSVSTKSTTTNTHIRNSNNKRATVMMLESPTGTGKSLSLACAALAWLRYMEQQQHAQQENTNRASNNDAKVNETTTEATKSAGGSPTGVDWLDSWISPEQRYRQDQTTRARTSTKEALEQLNEQLQSIRLKVKGDDVDEEREWQRRQNLVRADLTKVKMLQKKKFRHRRKKVKIIAEAETKEQDHCLPEYHSDANDHENAYDHDDEESQQQQANLCHQQPHIKQSSVLPASALLDGARLDGSNILSTETLSGVHPSSGVRKIIYAARTHSQLSQFVKELKRTHWGSNVRVTQLGGRKLLCCNPDMKGKSETALTEACLDLTKHTKTKPVHSDPSCKKRARRKDNDGSTGCPLLGSTESLSTLAMHILAQPCDIEDAARLGRASRTCAYYASRKSLAAAEVVVLPYSMLLSRPTREAIGLSLKEAFVIVDEAHNLPEALRSVHSCHLSLPVVQAALQQLTLYTNKYAIRLAGRNLFYLGQLRKVVFAFLGHLQQKGNDDGQEDNEAFTAKKSSMVSPAELLVDLNLDAINLFKIIRYMERSRLAQKLLGFSNINATQKKETNAINVADGDHIVESSSNTHNPEVLSKHVSAMSFVQTFLEKLNLSGTEGKVVTDWPSSSGNKTENKSRVQHPTLRYVLLQPASCFEDVLQQAHALALVGGTLRPFVHVAAELLGNHQNGSSSSVLQAATQSDLRMKNAAACSSKVSTSYVSPHLTTFTCDHVVSPSNVLVQCLWKGPTNRTTFDFRHQSRTKDDVCDELGRALLELCKSIPCGLVVFLPSYSYEATLVGRWEKTGLWIKLKQYKKLHREPRNAQQLDSTLQAYAKDATMWKPTGKEYGGAMLLSVIGGKMSEGINLANEMARGVVIVGLPYPDINDPVLQEKMAIMDKAATGGHKQISGRAYYQNLCMRAVNQSVGRAIRHANDYAAILLCDYRYRTQTPIWSGLPTWLRKSALLSTTKNSDHHRDHSFPDVTKNLEQFFVNQRQKYEDK